MPLAFIKRVSTHNQIAVWKVTEAIDWYSLHFKEKKEDINSILSLKNQSLAKHRLAARVLLDIVLNKPIFLLKDKCGKPYINNNPLTLSVSHSKDYVGIAVNHKLDTGIDIEKIDKKIERIAPKFIDKQTLASEFTTQRIEKLHVYWGAKEVLFKIYGKGELNFIENLLVEPFDFKNNGTITCAIRKGTLNQKYLLNYTVFNGYMLVYLNNKFE